MFHVIGAKLFCLTPPDFINKLWVSDSKYIDDNVYLNKLFLRRS